MHLHYLAYARLCTRSSQTEISPDIRGDISTPNTDSTESAHCNNAKPQYRHRFRTVQEDLQTADITNKQTNSLFHGIVIIHEMTVTWFCL